MIRIYKINTVVSIANILIFIIEFLLIAVTDFSENKGSSKDVALFSFTFLYIWLILPSILALALNKYRKKRKLHDVVFLVVNAIILIYNLPMFIDYLKSV